MFNASGELPSTMLDDESLPEPPLHAERKHITTGVSIKDFSLCSPSKLPCAVLKYGSFLKDHYSFLQITNKDWSDQLLQLC
ncbi:hypothetical protein D0856_07895 [Vibrio owensii]|nr:hypothetical protein D0856_07895 [Vibrio owensii]